METQIKREGTEANRLLCLLYALYFIVENDKLDTRLEFGSVLV